MEKVLRNDDKIRKAEEIYYRRKTGMPINSKMGMEEKKTYLGSKILLELLVILNLSLVIVAVQNKNFIFTEEFLNTVASYNVNLSKSLKSLIETDEKNVQEEEKKQDEEITKQNVSFFENDVVPNDNEISSINQMDLDIAEIKNIETLTNPISGTVTSGFGSRESKYQNVTGYHTGIDIGAEKGTAIRAANSGTVVLVSSKGDYGKHLKIENGKLQTLYAHCSKILVKEGDFVNSGQEIAKVRKYRKFNRSTFAF